MVHSCVSKFQPSNVKNVRNLNLVLQQNITKLQFCDLFVLIIDGIKQVQIYDGKYNSAILFFNKIMTI